MDDRTRYEQVHRIFALVCDLRGQERETAIDRACAGDPELRSEVEALLREDAESRSFLDAPALGERFELGEATADMGPEGDLIGTRIGGFRLRRVIARGGMGTVYEAVQESPHRTVAVKVMQQGLASRSAIRRFEYESQVLARLQHPGIAQVFEAGTYGDPAGGQMPFFAMEYIPNARTLTEFAAEKGLGVEQRLELFARVCDAVHHGHQKGVIHRDLKPANILVDSAGQPKVIDFGVARAVDSDMVLTTLQTRVGQLIGTLQYMSPEQCAADPHDLDTRSDVYALGVILFELLGERLPYDVSRAAVYEAARIIREDPPTRLSTIHRGLRGDIETITMKSIHKDREHRYQSAADLAQDIRRYLADEPIIARPPSAAYQLRKFARRHRTLAGGAAATFCVLVLGLIGTSWQAARAADAEGRAFDRAEAEKRLREEAVEARQQAQTQAAIAEAINGFLNEALLGSVSPTVAQGREITVREVFDETSRMIEGRFEDMPLVEASVRTTLGRMYLHLGAPAASVPHLRRAFELRTAVLGADDPTTLIAMNELGQGLWRSAKYDEARWMHEAAYRGLRAALGASARETVSAANDLAAAALSQNDAEKARTLLFEALEIAEVEFSEQDLLTVSIKGNIAHLHWELGDLEESARLHEEVCAARERTLGPAHPDTLMSQINVGATYVMLGWFDRAEPLLARALEHAPTVLGENHGRTLVGRNNLLWVRLEQGRFNEIVEPYEALVARCVAKQGDDHPDTIIPRSNLGKTYCALGRYEEALEQTSIALASSRRVMPGHWLEAAHLSRYGEALAGLGRAEEAETAMVDAWRMAFDRLGPADGRTVRVALDLVGFYERSERQDEAVAVLDEVVPHMVDRYGEDFGETLNVMNEYGRLLWEVGRVDEALEMHHRAYELRADMYGEEDFRTRQSLFNLAVQYAEKGRWEEAMEAMRRVLGLSERVDGPEASVTVLARATLGHMCNEAGRFEEAEAHLRAAIIAAEPHIGGTWEFGYYLVHHGTALVGLERFDEAESSLLRGYDLIAGAFDADHPRAQFARAALADLYERSGRPDEAARWRPSDTASSDPP